ncbi:aminoglycoside 3'-phosphotransferase [Kineococcus rhizosphaerae]|uniref:aminoglycoside 3'-phosphotransferase n=1 Tax=Kineococcus rhizosphaerae TaxID=559628 RepID=UPI001FE30B44|nr:aminoglycoside 3'-phosphotransferase [Kineococcus rhizosphaerae]
MRISISQVPADPVPVPVALRPVVARWGGPAGAGELPAAWVNAAGGTTFRVQGARGAVFCKWAPAGTGLDLAAEAERAAWAAAFVPVPRVLEHGEDASGSWLVTRALPGASAVAPQWVTAPQVAVPALGRALRWWHDAVPVGGCPFDWSVPYRLTRAVGDTTGLHEAPAVDRLVVCHGDACSPNTLLADGSGEPVGFVDLAAVGVADRWADLAVATVSLDWNYGEGWQETFLAAYGVAPDPVRTAYYRALWDVGP